MSVSGKHPLDWPFRRRLLELIEERRLSDEAFEKATGIPASTLRSWRNKDEPSILRRIRQIAAFFNVSADYLLGLSDERKPLPPGQVLVDQNAIEEIQNATTFEELEVYRNPQEPFAMEVPERWTVMTYKDWHLLYRLLQDKHDELRKRAKTKTRK